MDKEQKVKELAEQIGYQEIKEILDNLYNANDYEQAEKWFKEEILKKVSTHQHEECPHSLFFYLDDEIVMEQNNQHNKFLMSNHKIWQKFKHDYKFQDDSISELIKNSVKIHFNIDISEPFPYAHEHYYWEPKIKK